MVGLSFGKVSKINFSSHLFSRCNDKIKVLHGVYSGESLPMLAKQALANVTILDAVQNLN